MRSRHGCNARCAVFSLASATAFAGAMRETYVAVVASEDCPRGCWIAGNEVPLSTWPAAVLLLRIGLVRLSPRC